METRRTSDSFGNIINFMEVLTRRMDLHASRENSRGKSSVLINWNLNRRKARSLCKMLSSQNSFILYIKGLCMYLCFFVVFLLFSDFLRRGFNYILYKEPARCNFDSIAY